MIKCLKNVPICWIKEAASHALGLCIKTTTYVLTNDNVKKIFTFMVILFLPVNVPL